MNEAFYETFDVDHVVIFYKTIFYTNFEKKYSQKIMNHDRISAQVTKYDQ